MCFQDNDTAYNCSEQHYQQQKALFFIDTKTADSILQCTEPEQMKALSHKITGLDEGKWRKHARDAMKKSCHLKFSQSMHLKKMLMNSRGEIVEANRHDKFFSCGLALSDERTLNKSNWEGTNILGQILMELREHHNQESVNKKVIE